MEIITSQAYVKVRREIDWVKQSYTEITEQINLYENKVVTAADQFLIQDVYDMSYKSLSSQYGFLYLHTKRGVFSFTVKNDPRMFITEYKKLREIIF